ncbi:hypothetical protein DW064_13950 [Segatella copri]|uniref:Uncharacterized protein n=1 Tax=Segatella copri TaxID=165179 RepID=A0AA93BLT0_9BACT|nr:hypothetical protein DW064_13950 [Segatella copri]
MCSNGWSHRNEAPRYPAKGTGSHSYTLNGKTLTANFEHDYDWANMPTKYTVGNDEAFDGVARLMSDLGVAVEMKYAKGGSGARWKTC